MSDIFGDPSTTPIRQALRGLLAQDNKPGILQVVCTHLFVPWQLMYLDDDEADPKAELFWGMRCQIEQTLGVGVGLKTWDGAIRSDAIEPPIAYVNGGLPRRTLNEHRGLFPLMEFTEDKVIEDFQREDNQRPAFYFYCHAGFDDKGGIYSSWIELTNNASRLTLRFLRDRTRYGLRNYAPLQFRSAPLVFLNACRAGQVRSSLYQSLVGFLMNDKKAAGVIGAEADMPAYFATLFAKEFWMSVRNETPIGEALFQLRRTYWDNHHNPLPLLYSLYANAELKVQMKNSRGTRR